MTNDPSHPTETLTCKGQILEGIKADTKYVSFGRLARESTELTKTIKLARGDAGPITPTLKPGSNTENVNATLREIKPGEEYELVVTLVPPFRDQTVRGKLEIASGIEKDPSLILPVYATVTPRVTPHPTQVLVPVSPKSDWKQSVHLTWDNEKPRKILEASVSDPNIIAEVGEEDGEPAVVLHLADANVPPKGRQTLTITTDDSEMPKVDVPIGIARNPRPNAANRPVVLPSSTPPTRPQTQRKVETKQDAQRAQTKSIQSEDPGSK